ncbi:MAG: sarcosine oxidase subunit gamma family protein [Steroidobacteraceae bacterium]
MLEHHLPFDSVREGLGQSGLAIEHVDLRVTPVRDRGLLLLQAASVHALQDALDETIDLTLPKVQNTSVRGDYALLWLAPAEWLLELQVNETGAVESELSRRLSSSLAVVTDISDALVSFELSGAGVPEILMTGCSLDLRSPAFPPGRVARTALADVPAILWNPGKPDRLRCLIDRGFASHFLLWLEGAT